MKNTITVLITVSLLVLLILVSGALAKNSLEKSSGKFENYIARIEAGIEKGEWENAQIILSELQKNWHETKRSWAMLTDHAEIDNIDETLARIPKYLETRQLPLLLADLSILKRYFRHIPQKESLSLENVL